MVTIDGLVTGIDTSSIIQELLSVHQRQIELLQDRQARTVARQTAFQGIEAQLLALRSQTSRLGRTIGSVFDLRTVSSSHESLVQAAASRTARPGTYMLTVDSLAKAHQIASQGFDDPDAVITQGTLQIRVGSGATATITIDSTNNTLQGLADAINNADAGLTATIVNDGSDSRTQPYRLLLTADQSGQDKTIAITNNLAADNGGAVKPVLTDTYIGQAVTAASYTGTSTPSSNAGAGSYTGTANDTYTFTVVNGGTVGTDSGIQISFVDGSGENSGTITLDSSDAGVFKTVAEGLQVQFSAGTLVAGETFTVDVFVNTVQQPASATLTLGSGPGALVVQSDSNTVQDLIPGLTLDLRGADSSQPVTLTVAPDTESMRQAVLDFVDAYNTVMEYIDEQVRYESDTGTAGPLLGNVSVMSVQEQVRRAVIDPVDGLPTVMNRLAALGVTSDRQGRLQVDEATLDQALAGQMDNVVMDDVRRLFVLDGTSTNAGVQFVAGSSSTQASTTAYQVDLSQAAERATITASNSLAVSTVINSSNNTLVITLDGQTSGTITLPDGTYTRTQMAQELEAQINSDDQLSGRGATVTLAGDRLVITSQAYGYDSEVTVVSGTALATLGFDGTETDRGQDVVGKFIVDGTEEPAVGTGQFLVGDPDNEHTADLQVRVTLTSSQIQSGPEASLTITRGLASRLDVVLAGLLDPVTGRLKTIDNSLQREVDEVQEEIERQTERLQTRQEALVRQFVALERTVSQLQTYNNLLAAQLLTVTGMRNM